MVFRYIYSNYMLFLYSIADYIHIHLYRSITVMTNNMIISNVEMYALLHYMLVYLGYDVAEMRGILDLETKRRVKFQLQSLLYSAQSNCNAVAITPPPIFTYRISSKRHRGYYLFQHYCNATSIRGAAFNSVTGTHM